MLYSKIRDLLPIEDSFFLSYPCFVSDSEIPFIDKAFSVNVRNKTVDEEHISQHDEHDPVGINENSGIAASEPEMSCYPNPFSKELNIEINHDSVAMGILQIFDLQGRVIYEDKINTSSNCIQKLHWNGFDSSGNECGDGVYILQFVVDGNIVGCEKVVKLNLSETQCFLKEMKV